MIPSVKALLDYAIEIKGQPMQTIKQKRQFYVAVISDNLEFTPKSSSESRREPLKQLQAVLEHLENTNSFRAADYSEKSFNASYVLAFVKHWQNTRSE